MIAEAWLISAWYMSLANCSAANFQLQLMTHLCTPPITSVPPGHRSQNESRYHLKPPRYSSSDGAVGSHVPKIRPL